MKIKFYVGSINKKLMKFFEGKTLHLIIICLASFFLLTFMVKGLSGFYSILAIFIGTSIILSAIMLSQKDAIISVFYFILVVIIGSLIAPSYQVLFCSLSLLSSLLFILIKFDAFKILIISSYKKLINISTVDFFAWFIIFTFVLFLGNYDGQGFIANDPAHHINTLSAGHSYSASIVNTPDFSYAGKELRYNFLLEQVPAFLSNILGTTLLSAIYFEIFFLLAIISFTLIHSFTYRYYKISIPIFIIFFFPIYNLQYFAAVTIFRNTIGQAPSYFVAFILIVVAIHLLIKQKYNLLTLLSIVLLNIKGIFFITLMGGILLYLIRKRAFKTGIKFFSLLIPIFIIIYYSFLSGFASESLWLIFPQIIYERIPTIFFGRNIEFVTWRWASLWIPLIFLYSILFIYFQKKSDDTLLILSSFSLSGFLGMLIITEPVSLSARYFYVAAFFPMVLTFFYWFKEHYLSSGSVKMISLIPVWLYTTWAYILLIHATGIQLSKSSIIIFIIFLCIGTTIALRKFSFNIKQLAKYSIYIIVATTIIQEVKNNKLLSNLSNDFFEKNVTTLSDIKINEDSYQGFSNDLLQGYKWLNSNIDSKSVVLFGKHYEMKNESFIRSAISGKQMYSEGSKYRGICLENDYSFRFASVIYFYRNFVNSSLVSEKLLQIFQDKDYQFGEETFFDQSLEVEQEHSLKAKALFYLSLGKNWSWINIPAKIDREVKSYWKGFGEMGEKEAKQWVTQFLKSQSIDYIVLENGDKPSEFLLKFTEKVYENSRVTILYVNLA